jgi:hypothetical protein
LMAVAIAGVIGLIAALFLPRKPAPVVLSSR